MPNQPAADEIFTVVTLQKMATEQPSNNRFLWNVPDGWQQGRGAFGGLVLMAMARAAQSFLQDFLQEHSKQNPQQKHDDKERILRSVTGEILAPVLVGQHEIFVEMLRMGSGTATLAIRLYPTSTSTEVSAHAVMIFARDRGLATWNDLTPPAGAPHDVEPLPSDHGLWPRFAKHFDFRSTGPWPMSQHPRAEASGWVRPATTPPHVNPLLLLCLSDAWWPTALSRFDTVRPMGTLAFSWQLTASVEELAQLTPSSFFYHRAHSPAAQSGYTVELRELWSEHGALLALNQQIFAVIA